jgi:hypothetical protein
MDEAGRSTHPPLIMAPPVPKADPDTAAEDAVVDNGIMAPSRTRTGTSRSGVAQRGNGANGSSGSNSQESGGSASGAASAATEALPVVKEPAQAKPATVPPLPADIIGQGKDRPSSEAAAEGQGPGRQGSRQTMTSRETAAETEAPAAAEEDAKPAPKSEQEPLYTRPEVTPAPSASASTQSYAGSTDWTPRSESTDWTPSSGATDWTPGYLRSEWSTGPDSTPTPTPTTTATATASAERAETAPPATPGPAFGGSQPPNGYSGSGFSASTVGSVAAGAASAATGAAAGLASSVTSAWQRRSSGTAPKGAQVRKKPSKRQAMLTLSRVEPWSVMKFSFVASVVAFIILFVAVAVLYMVLAALGVFDSIQHTVTTMTSSQGTAGTNISHWTSPSLILGYTAMLGALNIVLITAMCTVGSVIYNLIAKTIGGIEVTLRETD